MGPKHDFSDRLLSWLVHTFYHRQRRLALVASVLALTPPALLCVRYRPRPKHKRVMWPTYCYRIDCRFRRLHNNSTWLKQEKEGIEYAKRKRKVVKEQTNDCPDEPDGCDFSTPDRPEPLTTLHRMWRVLQRFQRLVVRLVEIRRETLL